MDLERGEYKLGYDYQRQVRGAEGHARASGGMRGQGRQCSAVRAVAVQGSCNTAGGGRKEGCAPLQACIGASLQCMHGMLPAEHGCALPAVSMFSTPHFPSPFS